MKIVYLWIEDYYCIKQQGFNLCSEYSINYDYREKILTINKRKGLDSILYGPNTSITAIVGNNGAGKTTLLDAIRYIVAGREMFFPFIIVYQIADSLYYFETDNFVKYVNGEYDKDIPIKFENGNIIYYSDVLDVKYATRNVSNQSGVEQKAEFEDDISSSFYLLNSNTSFSKYRYGSNILTKYYHDDITRQVKYLNARDDKDKKTPPMMKIGIDFLSPKTIFDDVLDAAFSKYNYKDERATNPYTSIYIESYTIKLITCLCNVYEKIISSKGRYLQRVFRKIDAYNVSAVKMCLVWNFLMIYMHRKMLERKMLNPQEHNYSDLDNELMKIIPDESCTTQKIFEYIVTHFNIALMRYCIPEGYYRLLESLWFIESEGDFFLEISLPRFIEKEDIFIAFRYCNEKELLSLINGYYLYFEHLDFLSISWAMSSGEYSLLSLFARLYDIINEEIKEYIILLDEIDNSFHPAWQQSIIKELTHFLSLTYPNKKFQIILTTHSPVLLSDIPNRNIVYLSSEMSDANREHKETFAANIATLYYDSFFLSKGSIGSIARNTIINLFKALDNYTNAENKSENLDIAHLFLQEQFGEEKNWSIKIGNEDIEELIECIGEDIWRHKLKEQFATYCKKDDYSEYEAIIEKLKSIRNKDTGLPTAKILSKLDEIIEESNNDTN